MSGGTSYDARVDERPTRVQVTERGLDIGDRLISWLDVDGIVEDDHRVVLNVANLGDLRISGIGTVHDRFMNEFRTARRQARLPALAVAAGELRESFVSREPDGWIDVHLFDDVLVLDHRSGETSPIPLSLVVGVTRRGHDFVLGCRGLGDIRVGKLGATTDRFGDLLERTRRDQRARWAARVTEVDDRLAGCSMRDGWTAGPDDEPTWWPILGDIASRGERADEFEHLRRLTDRPLRLGLVAADGEIPILMGLAVHGRRIAVESLSGEARATFVFDSDDPDRLNAALTVAGFRREVVALPEEQLGRWAVAARTSSVVRELRGGLVARVEHRDQWPEEVRRALVG